MKYETPSDTKDLIKQLQSLTEHPPHIDDNEELRQQNNLLNTIFKRMLSNADRTCDPLTRYSLALRAQSQYVRTLSAIQKIDGDDETEE